MCTAPRMCAMPANLPQLTAFRFFAAAWVVLFGFFPLLRPEGAIGSEPQLLTKGYLGVELFFVLSGFILSHVYMRAWGEGRFRYGPFLWARIARIYPLHLATLAAIGLAAAAAAALGVAPDHDVASLASLPANLTLTNAWGLAPTGSWNHPSWSISAEWAAYLAFPAFAAAAWPLRRRPVLALALGLAGLFAAYALFPRLAGFPLTRATTGWGALRIVPPFFYGCVLHLAWRARPAPAAREAGLAVALFAAMLAAAVALDAPDGVIVAAGGGMILALAGLAGSGSRVLASPAWVWLGEVSFALYMIKAPWELLAGNALKHGLRLADGAAWPLWAWLAFVAGSLPAAALAHHLVERPARMALRRLADLRPALPREETAPAP